MNNLLFPDMIPAYEPIVLSLKKTWLERIVAGTKRYEFRRAFLRKPSCAFIYVVAPDSFVSHIVWFDTPLTGSPTEIAEIGERERPGGGESILAYLQDRTIGFAAPVLDVRSMVPLSLKELRSHVPRFYPPQSYLLLRNSPLLLKFLINHARDVVLPHTFSPPK